MSCANLSFYFIKIFNIAVVVVAYALRNPTTTEFNFIQQFARKGASRSQTRVTHRRDAATIRICTFLQAHAPE